MAKILIVATLCVLGAIAAEARYFGPGPDQGNGNHFGFGHLGFGISLPFLNFQVGGCRASEAGNYVPVCNGWTCKCVAGFGFFGRPTFNINRFDCKPPTRPSTTQAPAPDSSTQAPAPGSSTQAPAPESTPVPAPESTPVPAIGSTPAPVEASTQAPVEATTV